MWKEGQECTNSERARWVCGVCRTPLEKLLLGTSPMSCPRVLEGDWLWMGQGHSDWASETNQAGCVSLGNRQLWEGRVRETLWRLQCGWWARWPGGS